MSRLGKLPIELPAGTNVRLENGILYVSGPKGKLQESIHGQVKLAMDEKQIVVSVKDPEDKKQRALWGLFRSLVNNMVQGVNKPFEKKLEINGVGYRAAASGNKLQLNVGYSHPVEFPLPEGIMATVEKNVITLSGIDKQLVGEMAAQVRRIRKPEPYKGKGIKYVDEIIRRKAGKSAAKGKK